MSGLNLTDKNKNMENQEKIITCYAWEFEDDTYEVSRTDWAVTLTPKPPISCLVNYTPTVLKCVETDEDITGGMEPAKSGDVICTVTGARMKVVSVEGELGEPWGKLNQHSFVLNVKEYLMPIAKELYPTVGSNSWCIPLSDDDFYNNNEVNGVDIVELYCRNGHYLDKELTIEFYRGSAVGIYCEVYEDAELVDTINVENQDQYGKAYGLMECFWDACYNGY